LTDGSQPPDAVDPWSILSKDFHDDSMYHPSGKF
jgi:hypothetical protein